VHKPVAILVGVAILVFINFSILGRERLRSDGTTVLLQLAPVDPRSLMQGDYMALRFQLARELAAAGWAREPRSGNVVLTVDSKRLGAFARMDDGTPLALNEVRMKFRSRNGSIKFATNAWFFQEGTRGHYAHARYGEFRVDSNGESILTAMRNDKLEQLGPMRK
jgi:uncharacterized membrane-anchored protein